MLVWKGERFSLTRLREIPTLPMAVVFNEEGPGEQYQSESWDLADAVYVILCTADEKEKLDELFTRVDDTRLGIPEEVRQMKEVYEYFRRELKPDQVFFNEGEAHKRATELLKLWMTTKEERKHDQPGITPVGERLETPGTGGGAPEVQGGSSCSPHPGPGSTTAGLPLP